MVHNMKGSKWPRGGSINSKMDGQTLTTGLKTNPKVSSDLFSSLCLSETPTYTFLEVKLLFDFVRRPTMKKPEKSKQK